MAITNDLLNKHPLNCGNCSKMKTHPVEWQGQRRISAWCAKGRIMNTPSQGWLVDTASREAPLPWKAAGQCNQFDSMIGE